MKGREGEDENNIERERERERHAWASINCHYFIITFSYNELLKMGVHYSYGLFGNVTKTKIFSI